jgi:hypothetical protein
MSPISWSQSVQEQKAFGEVDLCTSFDILSGNSPLCQEVFVDTRQESHILPEGIATTPQSYEDNSGSELPDLYKPADKMLPSFASCVL